MKVVLLLGLVGAPIYGAILLSYDLLPHDPAANVFTGQSLGNLDDRQLRSWGTDLPALASSNSQEASLALRKAATTPASPSPVVAPKLQFGRLCSLVLDARAIWQRRSISS